MEAGSRFGAAVDEDFFLYAMLPAGTYRIRSTIDGTLAANNTEISASYNYSLLTGDLVDGNHTHPDFGTDSTDSDKLLVVAPAILSETDRLDGTTEVVVSASLQNTSPCPWNLVTLDLQPTFPGGPDLELLASIEFTSLDAQSTTAPEVGETIVAVVPTAELPAFRASVLDGSRFTTTGRELIVFLFPVQPILNAPNWIFNLDGKMKFKPEFDTAPGTLLIESPRMNRPDQVGIPPVEIEVAPLRLLFQGLDRNLPFLVSSVKEVLTGAAPKTNSLSGAQVRPPRCDPPRQPALHRATQVEQRA